MLFAVGTLYRHDTSARDYGAYIPFHTKQVTVINDVAGVISYYFCADT